MEIGEKPVSAGTIVQRNGKILLIKTLKGWEIPKGQIDKNETPREAAVRETLEETGISGKIISELGSFRTSGGKLVIIYLAKYLGGDLTPQKEEGILSVGWSKVDSARRKIVKYQRHLLKDLL